jgi:transposase
MGNPAGVRRDFQALEQRRMKAARLLEKGYPEAEVARRVGVHRQSVNRWAKELAAGGRVALKQAGRAGRKPRLTADDLRRIEEALKLGPEALGYGSSLWTAWRVADLIHRECGVKFTTGHVGRILRDELGWSPQRPAGRALERDETAIRRWQRVRWPELKKTPSDKDKPSSSSTKAD